MDVNMITTAKGHILKAKMETGVPLEITRIIAGAGRTDDLYHLESLVDYKQELTITGKSQRGTQAVFFSVLSNKGLKTGYDLTQLAICANDPDDGEILYKAAQLERAFPISADKDFPNFAIDCTFSDTISNASEVIVVVDPADMVTISQFEVIQSLVQETITMVEEIKTASTNSIILSHDPPAGSDWQLWLQIEGEIEGYPDTIAESGVLSITLDTAPLDAAGDYAAMYDDGSGETIINMTDNPDNAGENDIIIV